MDLEKLTFCIIDTDSGEVISLDNFSISILKRVLRLIYHDNGNDAETICLLIHYIKNLESVAFRSNKYETT